jgi:hypothetical protein
MADQQLPPLPAADEDSGFISLMEVEPSPVEDTPIEYKDSYFPAAVRSPDHDSEPEVVRRVNTLGLGNHGAAWYCMCCPSHPLRHKRPLTAQ